MKKKVKGAVVEEGCYFFGIDTKTGKVVNAEKPLPEFITRALNAQMAAIPEFFGIQSAEDKLATEPKQRTKH